MIEFIHTAVPGRIRFTAEGLKHSPELRDYMVSRLQQEEGISRVSAGAVTGSVLVLFRPEKGHPRMEGVIRDIFTEARQLPALPPAGGNGQGLKDASRLPEGRTPGADGSGPLEREGLRAWLQRFFADLRELPGPWHTQERETVLALLKTDPRRGLTESAAAGRRQQLGPNALPEAEPQSGLRLFLAQFNTLPVYLLCITAGLSAFTGGLLDAAVVMGVVAANAAIGSYTELKAERTIHSLKRFGQPSAEVVRSGRPRRLPAEQVVAGDILLLKPGAYVPADCRIIEANHLSVDESMLTGESLPADKSPRVREGEHLPLSDRQNMAYMGTLVTGGEGKAVVVATGRHTEIGRLQSLLKETATPEATVERQLRIIGDHLVLGCLAISGAVFGIGFLRGYGLIQMLRMSISLAAAAVPEGLPTAATINFALGIRKLEKDHVLVRDLHAVETLGGVQAICLDKTGTITRNRMEVKKVFAGMRRIEVEGARFLEDRQPVDALGQAEFKRLMEVGVLCNETKINGRENGTFRLYGSSTENALIRLAELARIDIVRFRGEFELLQIRHRSESRLFMSSRHRSSRGEQRFAVKGSPLEVLEMCREQLLDGQTVPLTDEDRLRIETENERMASDALRVLGFAFREGPGEADGRGLIWLGLVGMADPVREGVRDLIHILHQAGIRTIMITGDQSTTAYAVADHLGIAGDAPLEILDSSELPRLGPEALEALSRKVHVYARVSPSHKLQIVQSLQRGGRVVAMTGDGINDGPAMKAADIGIAMGKSGTDVAREVADIVLERDNLETLVLTVREGRVIQDNIRKAVKFFLATNMSEIMVMTAAVGTGLGFPLNVKQLLWINLISDIFPGLALSAEPPEAGVMERPPRRAHEPLFTPGDYRAMALQSGIISAAALAAYAFGLVRYGAGTRATSLGFQTLTIAQLLHAVTCRSETESVFQRRAGGANPYLTLAVGGSLILQGATIILPPLRRFLGLAPLGPADVLVTAGGALFSFAANEAVKLLPAGTP